MPSRTLALKRLMSLCEQAKQIKDDKGVVAKQIVADLEASLGRYTSICENDIEQGDQEAIEAEFDAAVKFHDEARQNALKFVPASPAASSTAGLESFLEQQRQVLETLSVSRAPFKHVSTLPKLEIPLFSGDPKEWPHFRDLFLSSINANDALTEVQKLQYLRSLLRGNAASIIANVPISSTNYEIAWGHLLDAYNNEYLVTESIITRFLECETVRDNHCNLRSVVNTFRETFEMLDNQSDYAASRDPLAIVLMLKKLDSKTDREWAEYSKSEREPSLEFFLEFLKTRCTIHDRTRKNSTVLSHSRSDPPSQANNRKNLKINATTTLNCMFCQGEHSIYKCPKFISCLPNERESFLSSQSRCFNCLSKTHSIKECPSPKNCSFCNKRHNTLLHRHKDRPIQTAPSSNPCESASTPVEQPFVKTHSSLSSSSLLPTAIVLCRNVDGQFVSARMLLDTGSQATLVSETFMRKLRLKRTQARVPVSGVGESSSMYSKGKVDILFTPHFSTIETFTTTAYVVPKLTSSLPHASVEISCMDQLRSNFNLADPTFNISSSIDIIAGASVFFETILSSTYINKADAIHIQETRLGYVVCSKPQDDSHNPTSHTCFVESPNYDDILERFWVLEEGPKPVCTQSPDERACDKYFKDTVQRVEGGRFNVRLPFKQPPTKLGHSYATALRRFSALEKKFNADSKYREEYLTFMSDYETLGHMTRTLYTEATLPDVHYLIPHHGIWQSGSGGQKLRVVFDASAKTSSGESLNSILHTGPRLQLDITTVINGFRKHRYVFTADIEKMYRQIQVHDSDQNCQMILWRNSPSEPLGVYQLSTVTYGESCSPYLALRTLQELIDQDGHKFPAARKILKENRYVDDILFGNDDRDALLNLKQDLIEPLRLGCFELKKWATNHPELLADSTPTDLAISHLFVDKESSAMKALGILWEPSPDTFSFQFSIADVRNWTKRSLLSDSARIFDPMGWISPVVLKLKSLFQATWVKRLDWDEDVPPDIMSEWTSVRSELPVIRQLALLRFFHAGRHEIHGFSDASKLAYAAAIYLRTISHNGSITTSLVMAKTKLAPIKPVSIPRLELCGAHLLARLIQRLQQDFPEIRDVYLWTDSTTVLAWLKSMPKSWTPFVCNRVALIHEWCPKIPWFYVKSAENPADIASRGLKPSQLLESSIWWNGPSFLREEIKFPVGHFTTDEECAAVCSHSSSVHNEFWLRYTHRHSNLHRLIRSLSYVFRLRDRLKRSPLPETVVLSADEVAKAFNFLIRDSQSRHFLTESDYLRTNRPLPRSSPIRTLTPFIDEDGILRARSRVVETSTICETPIILPRERFSDLIIQQTHIDTLHGGTQVMMSQIRHRFYILGLNRSVKRICRSCVRCLRHKAKTFSPVMGALPKNRTTPSKPFLKTGIDFAGPVSLRPFRGRGRTTLKGYIAILVCFATKAIHLELVMDLSTQALISALERFISRRGRCDHFYSDNGRNFVGCDRLLREFFQSIDEISNSESIRNFLSKNFIKWSFIPPYSPHFGGIWEAGVKSVKTHLRRSFNDTVLTIEEMITALCRIESILNSRPLVPIAMSGPYMPLTPAHLLTGEPSSSFPDLSRSNQFGTSARLRASLLADLVSHFWRRWRQEYLATLVRRPKWTSDTGQPSVGDIVLIKRDFDPPSCWRLGKIISLLLGSDEVARVAEVQSTSGISKEAIRNLVPLHVESDDSPGGEC